MGDTLKLAATLKGMVRSGVVESAGFTCVRDMERCIGPYNRLLPGTWFPHGNFEHNLVMYEAATVVAELLRGAPDLKAYKLGGMYIEFENNGGATVTPPSNTDRSAGISYYTGLSSDPNRDYLRVPLTAQTLESSDSDLYPDGNRAVNYAVTAGTVGVHGKTFSHTVQSVVYGGALVVTPVFSDDTQDIVFSRFYFTDTDNQLEKQSGSQISLTWALAAE